VFTTRGTWKVARVLADPRVALEVETAFGEPEAWVSIEGTATVRDEGGWEVAERLLPLYYDPARVAEVTPGWRRVADWVVIEIAPVRIRSRAPEG
jgi:hypothetical protein